MTALLADVLLWQFLYLPALLALRFIVAVQYKRGGFWAVLTPLALRAAILDVYLNYTTCAVLFWEWPKKGEATISKRCKRWVFIPGFRGGFARLIANFTNRFDNNHIPLP